MMSSISLVPGSDLVRRRLRIAVVAACPMPSRRGTPLRVERLAEALAARGHQVELVTYHLTDDDAPLSLPVHRIFDREERRRTAVGPSLRKLFLYDPALARTLWRLLTRKPFDVIYAHHFEGALCALPAGRRHGLPVIYDAHTMLASELPSYAPTLLRGATRVLGRWLDGLVPSWVNHSVTVTRDIRDRLIADHGIDPDDVTVVMNGVESALFAQSGSSTVSPEPNRLIYTGTLAAYQDVGLLLEAFALAHQQRPAMRLTMSVSSSFDRYEEQARRLGIRAAIDVVADTLADLPARLAQARIAVMPRTRCDGIPQKLLNYMAAGNACVASAGSAKVMENEVTGLVVPDGDAAAFAAALVRLVDDPALAARLADNARSFAQRQCRWELAAERVEAICESLVGRSAEPSA